MDIDELESLTDIQKYIWQMNVDRGFSDNTPEQKMLLLTEEFGELAKAIRKTIGMGFDAATTTTEVKEELADVQILLLGLASMLDVDMTDAIRIKEDKNRKRTWS